MEEDLSRSASVFPFVSVEAVATLKFMVLVMRRSSLWAHKESGKFKKKENEKRRYTGQSV